MLPLHPPADDLIHTQHTTVSAPPSLHPSASADPSLHRSFLDMSSIRHAPTAADYFHFTVALASTYRHAKTSLRPPTTPAFNHHPAVDASVPSASLQLPASAFHSSVHWEIDYRKIIGIYRNFDGKLLHSYFTTVSDVFWELIAPNLMILLLFR